MVTCELHWKLPVFYMCYRENDFIFRSSNYWETIFLLWIPDKTMIISFDSYWYLVSTDRLVLLAKHLLVLGQEGGTLPLILQVLPCLSRHNLHLPQHTQNNYYLDHLQGERGNLEEDPLFTHQLSFVNFLPQHVLGAVMKTSNLHQLHHCYLHISQRVACKLLDGFG